MQLDLYLAETSSSADAIVQAWTKGLDYLKERSLELFYINPMKILLEKGWLEASSHLRKIQAHALESWLRNRNLNVTKKQVKRYLQDYDADFSGSLDSIQFHKLVLDLSRSKRINDIFEECTNHGRRLKGVQLKKFMDDHQLDLSMSIEVCGVLICVIHACAITRRATHIIHLFGIFLPVCCCVLRSQGLCRRFWFLLALSGVHTLPSEGLPFSEWWVPPSNGTPLLPRETVGQQWVGCQEKNGNRATPLHLFQHMLIHPALEMVMMV